MTEFAAYLDASGHPDDRPRVIVAGFIATEQQWLSFEGPWKDALKRHGLGDVFHMTDFEAQRRKDRAIVLDDLTDIITKHTTAPVSCLVEMADYKRVNELYVLEEGIGKPYSVAARGVVRNINLWKRQFFRAGDHLLIFVEEGTKHHGDMEDAFRRDELPVPQKVPKNHPSVQPADMLGWEIQHYERFHDNRRSFMKLLRSDMQIYEAHGKFSEKQMMYSCKQINVPLRKNIAPDSQIVFRSLPRKPRKRTILP